MYRKLTLIFAAVALHFITSFAFAEETAMPPPPAVAATAAAIGSTAFCLYELPSDDEGRRRWLNLGIVQYVEYNRNELRIYYGGGNLGSGHESKLPIANPAQLEEALSRIRQAATNCR